MTDITTSRKRPWLGIRNGVFICAAVVITMVVGRLWLLLTFGGSVPFWDQWGGENSLFGPATDGTLSLSQLLAAHNEHRIFWTRLTTIALFLLNGKQWDNTVEAAFTVMLFGGAALFPLWVVARSLPKRGLAIFFSISLLGALLPYAWENLLVGFQSQFVYCSLFSMAAIYIAGCRDVHPGNLACVFFLLAAAFLSMATGVLAALAVTTVYLARAILAPAGARKWPWIGFASSFAIAIGGRTLTPTPGHHVSLHARDIPSFVDALGIAFSWPVPWCFMLLVLAPVAVWLLRAYIRGEFRRADFFFLGVLCLGILNAIAVAYSRGGDLKEVPSRYLDGLFFISLASAYFAASVLEASRCSVRIAFGYLPLLLIAGGLVFQSISQAHFLRERAYFTRMETANMARFFGGDPKALIDKPHAHVPYPDPAALEASLRASDHRPILPASVMGLASAPWTEHGCSIRVGDSSRYIFTCPDEAGAGALPSAGRLSAWFMRARQTVAPGAFAAPTVARYPLPIGDSKCAVDSVDEKSTTGHPINVGTDTPIRIKGWGKYAVGIGWLHAQPVRIALRGSDASYQFSGGMRRFARPDVASALGLPRYLWSGFDAFIDVRTLPPGDYEILVAAGSSPYCESGHRLRLLRTRIPLVWH